MSNIKLSPPQIDITLPPIIFSDDKFIIKLPFYSNPAVATGDVDGLKIIVKNVSTGSIKEQKEYRFNNNGKPDFGTIIPIALDATYIAGQYYKMQIAYLSKYINDDNEEKYQEGYFSQIGVSKCTNQPQVEITNLQLYNSDGSVIFNENVNTFIGQYTNNDQTEKVYSYCFTIFDENGIYDTSGVLLHDINSDVNKITSIDTWTSNKILSQRKSYKIYYEVTTINGLTAMSASYLIRTVQNGFITTNGEFVARMNQEDGCVKLHFKNLNNQFVMLEAGDYVITRASDKDNFKTWIKLIDYILPQDTENVHFFNDYTVEQGVSYKYGLQLVQPNKNLTARKEAFYYNSESDELNNNRVASLKMDFEDAFLSDGKRQLCIRFNPKISTFKPIILESKTDTLGGKYPFIFRNGNVNYKEFSISGLISMCMDTNFQFLHQNEAAAINRFTTPGDLSVDTKSLTNLTGDNFQRERLFKTEVLEWLSNGEPKLFRSPAEGNFIIYTMNTSLSPNDTLGRMLHTFTCTAYEMAEFTMENLLKYNLMQKRIEVKEKNIIVFKTETLTLNDKKIFFEDIRYLSFEGAYSDCFVKIISSKWPEGEIFNIGNSTGKYSFMVSEEDRVESIEIIETTISTINLTYGYKRIDTNLSHSFQPNIISSNILIKQFTSNQCVWKSSHNADSARVVPSTNIISKLESDVSKVNYCYLLRITPKPIVNVAWDYDQEKWVYATRNGNEIIRSTQPIIANNSVTIYHNIKPSAQAIQDNTTYFIYCADGAKNEYGETVLDEVNGEKEIKYYPYLLGEPDYSFKLNNNSYSFIKPEPISYELINGQLLASQNNTKLLQNNNCQYLVAPIDLNKPVNINELITSGRFDVVNDVGSIKTLEIGNGLMCDIVCEIYKYTHSQGEV